MEQPKKQLNPVLIVLIAAAGMAMMAAYGLTHLQPVPDIAPYYEHHATTAFFAPAVTLNRGAAGMAHNDRAGIRTGW